MTPASSARSPGARTSRRSTRCGARPSIGAVQLDLAYASNVCTVFGVEARDLSRRLQATTFDGDLSSPAAEAVFGQVEATAFAYLIDHDTRLAFSIQTYGLLAKAAGSPLSGIQAERPGELRGAVRLRRQPGVVLCADLFCVMPSIEQEVLGFGPLGGPPGARAAHDGLAAVQTPLATLHAFNGWRTCS